jgi:hypothetical protein
MKKALLLVILPLLLLLSSCSKDEINKETTLMVNISTSGYVPFDATYIIVVFEDTGKEIDYEASGRNGTKLEVAFKDKTSTSDYLYTGISSVNTFENIPVGKYILFAYCSPYGFLYHYSIKKVELKNEIEYHSITFTTGGNFGYQEWK